MARSWFPHGKWPKVLVGLHTYTIVSFLLLVVTGVALYLPAIHTILIPILQYIYDLHIFLGLLFTLTLFAPFLRLLPKGRTLTRVDWLIPVMAGTAIVATGLLLWGVTVFPIEWRAPAFTWHGVLTVFLGGWILMHAFLKALGLRPHNPTLATRVNPDRRMFLKWISSGIAGAAVLTVLDPLALLRSLVSFATQPGSVAGGQSTGQASGLGSQGFAEYYTVTGSFPNMTLAKYTLRVQGNVQNPIVLTWDHLRMFLPTRETVNFQCVTGWSVPHVHWQGVRIADLMDLVHPQGSVKYVNFYSFDGVYTESLPLSEALDPSVLLAYQLNGTALQVEQGFPLRLVVPKMYGYKSIKWVSRIEFSDTPIVGYWEQRGYASQAYI